MIKATNNGKKLLGVPVDFTLMKQFPNPKHRNAAGAFAPSDGIGLFKDGIRKHANAFGRSLRTEIANTYHHETLHRATIGLRRSLGPQGTRVRDFADSIDESLATGYGNLRGWLRGQ